MGGAVSSPKSHTSSPDERQQESKTTTQPDVSPTFHPFSRLPYELRRDIWVKYIYQETPRVYSLELDITCVWDPREGKRWQPTSIQLVPTMERRLERRKELIRRLAATTATCRNVGATCFEARKIMLSILPDTLEMKVEWEYPRQNNPKETPISMSCLRFDANRDIIAIRCCNDFHDVLKWDSLGGALPFRHVVRHLGIDITFFEQVHIEEIWKRCSCGQPQCRSCSVDPLPNFLRLFPRLSTLYMARRESLREEGHAKAITEGLKSCNCDGSEQKHESPTFKGMKSDTFYISHKDYGTCSHRCLPNSPLFVDEGNAFGSKWPHYEALSNIEMRVLQRVVTVQS